MAKFKRGDRVRILPYRRPTNGTRRMRPSMRDKIGEVVEIESICIEKFENIGYEVVGFGWCWDENWLELVEDQPQQDPPQQDQPVRPEFDIPDGVALPRTVRKILAVGEYEAAMWLMNCTGDYLEGLEDYRLFNDGDLWSVFTWGSTPQDHNYWERIAEKIDVQGFDEGFDDE